MNHTIDLKPRLTKTLNMKPPWKVLGLTFILSTVFSSQSSNHSRKFTNNNQSSNKVQISSIFILPQYSKSVLRSKRSTSKPSETQPPNRERECIEETCSFPEMVQIFNKNKNDAKIFQTAYKSCRKSIKYRRKNRKYKSTLRSCIKDQYSSGFLSKNPCDYESVCGKKGTKTCQATGGDSFVCVCKDGWLGKKCESKIDLENSKSSSEKQKISIERFKDFGKISECLSCQSKNERL